MCRSIKQLRNPAQLPTDAEIEAAALQFVRKVSGYRAPSAANQQAFNAAVADIAGATRRLLDSLVIRSHAAVPLVPVTIAAGDESSDQRGLS